MDPNTTTITSHRPLGLFPGTPRAAESQKEAGSGALHGLTRVLRAAPERDHRLAMSLYFVACIDMNFNELITLEIIHMFVETLDRYFGNVCELDIMCAARTAEPRADGARLTRVRVMQIQLS